MTKQLSETGPGETSPASAGSGDLTVCQTIFEHGGSRIWLEDVSRADRTLVADTYGDRDLAIGVRQFVEEWWKRRSSPNQQGSGA